MGLLKGFLHCSNRLGKALPEWLDCTIILASICARKVGICLNMIRRMALLSPLLGFMTTNGPDEKLVDRLCCPVDQTMASNQFDYWYKVYCVQLLRLDLPVCLAGQVQRRPG